MLAQWLHVRSPQDLKVQLLHVRPVEPPEEEVWEEECLTEVSEEPRQQLTPLECLASQSPAYSHLFYLPGCQSDIKLSVIADVQNQSYVQKEAAFLATEYALMKSAAHPHVVKTFGFISDRDQHVIIMEHCANGDLLDRLRLVGGLSQPVARRIMKQLVAAMQHCHRLGIAHLDVKPENVFFDDDFAVRLGDFGHSRRVSSMPLRNYTLGTPEYMAPEILARQPYDGLKADVFSAGVVLFMLLTAHHPFGRATYTDPHFKLLQQAPARFWEVHEAKLESHRVASVPEDFKELVCGMTVAEPQARLTWREVASHVWMRGETAMMETVRRELNDF